jgi:hypothetical protein
MSIKVRCSTCGAKLKAPDAAAGRRLDCPHCNQVVPVPPRAAAPPPSVAGRGEASDLDEKPGRNAANAEAVRRQQYEQLADEIDEQRSHRREAAAAEDVSDADLPGAIGLGLGVAAAFCLLAGCFTLGLTYWVAAPFAAAGAGCAAFSRSRLRLIGLAINLLLLIPAVLVFRSVWAAATAPELPAQPFVH